MPQLEILLRKLKKQIECFEFALNHSKFFITNEIDFIINSIDFDSESLLVELNKSVDGYCTDESDEMVNEHEKQEFMVKSVSRQLDSDHINKIREQMIEKLREYKEEFLSYHQDRHDANEAYAFKMDLMRKQEKYSAEYDALKRRMARFASFEELDASEKEIYEDLYKQVDKELHNLKKHFFKSTTIMYLSNPVKSLDYKTIGSLLIIENLFLNDFERELCKKFYSQTKFQGIETFESSRLFEETSLNLFSLLKQLNDDDLKPDHIDNSEECVLIDSVFVLVELLKKFISSPSQIFIYKFKKDSLIEEFKDTDEIDLNYCGISVIQTGLFRYFKNLKRLKLKSNKLEKLTDEFIDDLSQTKIEELYLKNNRLNSFKISLNISSSFMYLKILNLNDNKIESLTANHFCLIKNLEVLELASNQIVDVNIKAFSGLAKLRVLNLHGNQLHELNENLLCDLKSLVELNLSKNQLFKINQGAFNGVEQLKVLNLKENCLESLQEYTFRNLKSLRELNLYKNQIKAIGLNTFHDQLVNLTKLDISSNQMNIIDDAIFNRLVNLKELKLMDNQMKRYCATLLCGSKKLIKLDLQINQFKKIHENQFNQLGNLVELNLSFNKLKVIYENSFNGLFSLKILNLRMNAISLNTNQFRCLKNLEELDLSLNSIVQLYPNTFNGLGNLKVLHLNENSLELLNESHFSHLQNLVSLNLFKNSLNQITVEPFRHLKNLKSINARSNNLIEINENEFERYGIKILGLDDA